MGAQGFTKILLVLLSALSFQTFAQKNTYVIVHGAWGGAWQFKSFANILESYGNKVYRVNLTGLGERYHLASKEIDLNTHIKDVVNTILFEQLDSVILMGHSYGGMVITGVADSVQPRIKKMIYLDALLPENNERGIDLIGNEEKSSLEKMDVDGFLIPPWVNDSTKFPRDVPHPIKTFETSIRLENEQRIEIPTTYIFTFEGKKQNDIFYPSAQRANDYGWKVIDFEAGHNPQITALNELVEIILNEEN